MLITDKEARRTSKFLSLVLRHRPEAIGISMDENGWTDVAALIEKMNENGIPLNLPVLREIVDTNDKKRFVFNEDQTRIRAAQGHSVEVELGYQPQQPPPVLYHGTAAGNTEAILREGIHKKLRHHVHLSTGPETAILVGKRHGKPVVLEVLSGEMDKDGYTFFISENGVWLTEQVPARYIRLQGKTTDVKDDQDQ